jgi:hypothetical protein
MLQWKARLAALLTVLTLVAAAGGGEFFRLTHFGW